MESTQVRNRFPWPAIVPVAVVVCVGIGWFFGTTAGAFYVNDFYPHRAIGAAHPPRLVHLGRILGMTSGFLVAVCWSCAMLWIMRQAVIKRPIAKASFMGLIAGLVSTAVLHAGLVLRIMNDPGRPARNLLDVAPLGIGICCGIVAGAMLGALGGVLCAGVRRLLPSDGAFA